ncbi:FAD/NAD(P)-binding domain-containing protein, partial [Aureobasidium melanogenum]
MSLSTETPLEILILGGGVAGLTAAMALAKFSPATAPPKIRVFEIRPKPGVIGGAVNLTPNALRLLDRLDVLPIMRQNDYGLEIDCIEVFSVYQPVQLGESSFRGPEGKGLGDPPYKALRVTRADVMKALVEAVEKCPNVEFICGKKTTKIDEDEEKGVTLTFEDGTTAHGDMLVGCDGIHSVTRLKHVEPERKEIYAGIANAFGFAPLNKDNPKIQDASQLHFHKTAINFARRGMMLSSFYEPTKTSVYVGGVLQVPEIASRDGWKVRGADQELTKQDMRERFATDDVVFDDLKALIDTAEDWFMWPIFTLPPEGRWATQRTMLLGDAAHAMPPQGEATGIVLEDTVLFARCLARQQELGTGSFSDAFAAYERLRRDRINAAFKESGAVVKTVQDAGWLGHKIKCFVVPWFLWFTSGKREKHFTEDVTTSDLGF